MKKYKLFGNFKLQNKHLFGLVSIFALIGLILFMDYNNMENQYPQVLREALSNPDCSKCYDHAGALTMIQLKIQKIESQMATYNNQINQNTSSITTLNKKIKDTEEELNKELARGQNK